MLSIRLRRIWQGIGIRFIISLLKMYEVLLNRLHRIQLLSVKQLHYDSLRDGWYLTPFLRKKFFNIYSAD